MGRHFNFNSDSDKVFSREDIQGMTTDEINQCMSHFKKLIREARITGKDTHDYEVEYCYLDNETQSRSRYEFTSPRTNDKKPRYGNQSTDRRFHKRGAA